MKFSYVPMHDFALQYHNEKHLCLFSNFLRCSILHCLHTISTIQSLFGFLSFISYNNLSSENSSQYNISFMNRGRKWC